MTKQGLTLLIITAALRDCDNHVLRLSMINLDGKKWNTQQVSWVDVNTVVTGAQAQDHAITAGDTHREQASLQS